MSIYSRRQITARYRELLKSEPRLHAIQTTASEFGHSAETIEQVITQSAVTAYLHALGLDGAPAAAVLKAAAEAFGMDTGVLMDAVQEQHAAMEA
ncbi:hypothetical protein [Roseateles terrae]|uniref:Uncharacterized protein n=1 Tax=Roseateles terrae TaxID=431060 RepID=A0ABR6GPD8_9BURK|nr:hypothetical protein [Roseateles terrae]MBB3193970.1 hypothetical protein [Roseateles terrae]OWQ87846.1 hypothetical protein CDN98_06685 [Roseateles terrae]